MPYRIRFLWLPVLLIIGVPEIASAQAEKTIEDDSATTFQDQQLPERATSTTENQTNLEQRITRLEKLITELNEKAEEDELAVLIAEAEAEADAPEEEDKPEEREFLWGALALQKLNPEITVSADILVGLIVDGSSRFYGGVDDRSGIGVREVGLQFQHVLDPFSSFKMALNFTPEPDPSIEVEEVYITWFGIIPAVSLSVGRFRQNFGIINRWHGHDLDQTDYPMALTQVLGEGGLNQTGILLKWFMPPLIAHANELTIEVTNSENATLFAGDFFSIPSAMVHLKNYYDANEDTYIEFGLSGIWGMNNKRGFVNLNRQLVDEPWRQTLAGGIDFTLHWSPLQKAKYRSVTWRTEGYFVHKETSTLPNDIAAGIAEADGQRISWGAFSYLDYQIGERWFAGVRGDIALPTVRMRDRLAWDVVPYLTFWQSEFVYLRLEYQYGDHIPHLRPDDTVGLRTDSRIMLQIDFAAGPHKHERY